jgi:putative N6-adenine-specific DNA methylase
LSLQLIATAAFGLEAVVARELKQLGYSEQQVENGRVGYSGDEQAICRSNLWLRSADRVLLQLGAFDAGDFGALFDQTHALPWADWLPVDAQFPVRGKSVRSKLHSVPDCQSIVKKAIVEKLKKSYAKTRFAETGPEFPIEVSIVSDRATLTLDTTGPGLHKRGYRASIGPSPLKETLAAGLVQLSDWRYDRPFLDPFCGTGTLPIEAALIGRNIAPGLSREFVSERWPALSQKLWTEARDEARDAAVQRTDFTLVGTDVDARALSQARNHARLAGVADDIHFQQQPFAEVTTSRKYGCLVCNPPYGERTGSAEADAVHAQMPQVFARLETWSFYVLTTHGELEALLGRKADRRRKLYNGRIACTYYQFFGPRPPRQVADGQQGTGDRK